MHFEMTARGVIKFFCRNNTIIRHQIRIAPIIFMSSSTPKHYDEVSQAERSFYNKQKSLGPLPLRTRIHLRRRREKLLYNSERVDWNNFLSTQHFTPFQTLIDQGVTLHIIPVLAPDNYPSQFLVIGTKCVDKRSIPLDGSISGFLKDDEIDTRFVTSILDRYPNLENLNRIISLTREGEISFYPRSRGHYNEYYKTHPQLQRLDPEIISHLLNEFSINHTNKIPDNFVKSLSGECFWMNGKPYTLADSTHLAVVSTPVQFQRFISRYSGLVDDNIVVFGTRKSEDFEEINLQAIDMDLLGLAENEIRPVTWIMEKVFQQPDFAKSFPKARAALTRGIYDSIESLREFWRRLETAIIGQKDMTSITDMECVYFGLQQFLFLSKLGSQTSTIPPKAFIRTSGDLGSDLIIILIYSLLHHPHSVIIDNPELSALLESDMVKTHISLPPRFIHRCGNTLGLDHLPILQPTYTEFDKNIANANRDYRQHVPTFYRATLGYENEVTEVTIPQIIDRDDRAIDIFEILHQHRQKSPQR